MPSPDRPPNRFAVALLAAARAPVVVRVLAPFARRQGRILLAIAAVYAGGYLWAWLG